MQPKYKITLLAAAMSLSFVFGDRAINFASETLDRLGWADAPRTFGTASAQENPDDDDDDEEDQEDPGGDGGDDDPGNDGTGDDPGDDSGGDDPGGDDPGGDDGVGGDDDGVGGDDDGPGGDDDGGTGGGTGGDDDGPGGDDDGGTGGGTGGNSNDDDDDDPPGGAGVRGLDGAESLRIRDGDDDARGPSALPEGVDVDSEGRWVKAGEILALEADPTSLEFARGLGFQVIERHRLTTLGMSIVELRIPAGQNTREALEAVRRGDPDTAFDFNHVYESVQGASAPARSQHAAPRANGPGATVGIVDTAIDTTHPALRGVRIQQINFAGRNAPVEHGTAVASVLASDNANHRLLAASVVERQTRQGGELASADALVRALDWLAQNRAPVANISLAGPPNALVEDAIRRAQARGMIIVAAVGNDGPAAPPLYPAAYEGVVGVTAVDQRGGIYRRAGRGAHVDVAAPGVGVVVAAPGGRMTEASGTSYAAPAVAAALAQHYTAPDPNAAQGAVQQLLRSAADAGERGTDPVYGAGVMRAGQTP
jgi:hypothetical protein